MKQMSRYHPLLVTLKPMAHDRLEVVLHQPLLDQRALSEGAPRSARVLQSARLCAVVGLTCLTKGQISRYGCWRQVDFFGTPFDLIRG
jgi:hypothetical protein